MHRRFSHGGLTMTLPRRRPASPCARSSVLRRGKFICGVADPARDDATRAIGVGLCETCAADPAQVEARIIEGLSRLWPGIPAMKVGQHPSGHA